jgi:hypothetical protein
LPLIVALGRAPTRDDSDNTRRAGDEYQAGLERAISNGWLIRHESGVCVKFTQAGADLFA